MTRLDVDTHPSGRPHGVHGSLWRRHWLLAPGVLLLRNLRFRAKFAMVMLGFLAPLSVLLYIAERDLGLEAKALAREHAGAKAAGAMTPLIQQLQRHRGLQAAVLGGAGDMQPALDAARTGTSEALQALRAHASALQSNTGTDAMAKLEAAVDAALTPNQRGGAAAAFQRHTQAIDAVEQTLEQVVNGAGLALDSDPVSHYLSGIAVSEAPALTEMLGQLRGLGGGALARGRLGEGERDTIMRLVARARVTLDRQQHAIARLGTVAPELAGAQQADAATAAAGRFLDAVNTQLLGKTLQGDAAAYIATGTKAIDAQFDIIGTGLTQLDKRLANRLDHVNRQRVADAATVVGGLLLTLYLLVAFYRVMGGGLNFVGQQVAHLASGDLTARPTPWGRDEVADSMHALRNSLVSLGEAVKTIQQCSQEVSNAAGELSHGNEDLSQRTQRSAAALEQTTSALQHLSELVQRNVDAVTHADKLVSGLSEQSRESGAMVQAMVERVAEVHAGSRKVAEIVDLIDGIAFQTNILALNASVEAARAGSAGRGFTIVAQEVRELSQRTAAAARDITALIRETHTSVDQASELGERVGSSVGSMVESVQRTASLVNEVNRDSLNQARSVEEIVRAVVDVNDTVQQNAALVEQLSSSAHMLTENGDALRAAVARFRVDARGRVHPADLTALHTLLQNQRPAA